MGDPKDIPADTMAAWRRQLGLDDPQPVDADKQAIIDAHIEDHFNRTVRPHIVPGTGTKQ